jgi:hypothetical protein
MNAKISIKTDGYSHHATPMIVIFKLFVVFVMALSVVITFYQLKLKRLHQEETMLFKIFHNLLEVNPDLLKIQDKHEILEDVHG